MTMYATPEAMIRAARLAAQRRQADALGGALRGGMESVAGLMSSMKADQDRMAAQSRQDRLAMEERLRQESLDREARAMAEGERKLKESRAREVGAGMAAIGQLGYDEAGNYDPSLGFSRAAPGYGGDPSILADAYGKMAGLEKSVGMGLGARGRGERNLADARRIEERTPAEVDELGARAEERRAKAEELHQKAALTAEMVKEYPELSKAKIQKIVDEAYAKRAAGRLNEANAARLERQGRGGGSGGEGAATKGTSFTVTKTAVVPNEESDRELLQLVTGRTDFPNRVLSQGERKSAREDWKRWASAFEQAGAGPDQIRRLGDAYGAAMRNDKGEQVGDSYASLSIGGREPLKENVASDLEMASTLFPQMDSWAAKNKGFDPVIMAGVGSLLERDPNGGFVTQMKDAAIAKYLSGVAPEQVEAVKDAQAAFGTWATLWNKMVSGAAISEKERAYLNALNPDPSRMTPAELAASMRNLKERTIQVYVAAGARAKRNNQDFLPYISALDRIDPNWRERKGVMAKDTRDFNTYGIDYSPSTVDFLLGVERGLERRDPQVGPADVRTQEMTSGFMFDDELPADDIPPTARQVTR